MVQPLSSTPIYEPWDHEIFNAMHTDGFGSTQSTQDKDRSVSNGRPGGCALYLAESVPKVFPCGESVTIRKLPPGPPRPF